MFRGLLVLYREVWYSPLASTNFCRLRARIFVIPSILFVSSHLVEDCEIAACHLSKLSYSSFMTLFLLERQLHFRLLFYFNSNIYIRGLCT